MQTSMSGIEVRDEAVDLYYFLKAKSTVSSLATLTAVPLSPLVPSVASPSHAPQATQEHCVISDHCL